MKPNSHQAWYNRGNALVYLGQNEEAIASFEKALVLKPNKDQAWNNRGIALSELGRHEAAINSYDQSSSMQAS
ncbi:MAG: tetratricopeptide repeat protein [Acaryochloridaceae cyanobacterium CSU_5_19]|nr:tetratricopeptide repeat protein [Acaryochloridaceae cyanobacterium CSU_5_19]